MAEIKGVSPADELWPKAQKYYDTLLGIMETSFREADFAALAAALVNVLADIVASTADPADATRFDAELFVDVAAEKTYLADPVDGN